MTAFFISNDDNKVKFAKNKFDKVFEKNFIIEQLTKNIQITYYEQDVYKKEIQNGKIFGFGFFFNEKGFFGDALENVWCIDSFKVTQKKELFGHYIFIIVKNDNIYLITDKVGMLNLFYYQNNNDYCLSSDLPLLGILAPDIKLSPQGVKEFLLKESTISSETIFEGIKRLKFGHEILISDNVIHEKESHYYKFEKLSFEEYTSRIEYYFQLLNKYPGKITTDMSAGFDTRLIASIAHKVISNIEANTNPNQFDGGIDQCLAPIIANKLKLKLTNIENNKECNDNIKMLHFFSIGRDIIRSKFWLFRLENKYQNFDLSLGGYGGEAVRAKYNNKSILEYYMPSEVNTIVNNKTYCNLIKSSLQNYTKYKTNNQETNFIYIVDRMRIWGGTQVYVNFLYGNILHPFMDWYLINPIFSMPPEMIRGGQLQEKLIYHFAPQLYNIPINQCKDLKFKIRNIKYFIKNKIKKSIFLTKLSKILTFNQKNKMKQIKYLYQEYPKEKINISEFNKIGININDIEKSGEVNILSRLITVNEAFLYVKKPS